MSVENHATVTLGVDAGGKDANSAMVNHYMRLRRLLAQECCGVYSPVIKEFALVLRIDGSVQSWNKRGVDNVRLQKKLGYATADIFVSSEIWRTGNCDEIRNYLASEVEVAIRQIIESAERANVQIESNSLLRDLSTVIEKFLIK